MSRKIMKAALFFLAVLLMSAPAWSSTSTDFNPAVLSTSLTAETGTGFILARGPNGQDSPGDCDPNGGPNGPNGEQGGPNGANGPGPLPRSCAAIRAGV